MKGPEEDEEYFVPEGVGGLTEEEAEEAEGWTEEERKQLDETIDQMNKAAEERLRKEEMQTN